MIPARARCWVHEDCLADLGLSIACGSNPPDMQALHGDWGYGPEGWSGDGYSGGTGNGWGVGVIDGDCRGDGDSSGYGYGIGYGDGGAGGRDGGGGGGGMVEGCQL